MEERDFPLLKIYLVLFLVALSSPTVFGVDNEQFSSGGDALMNVRTDIPVVVSQTGSGFADEKLSYSFVRDESLSWTVNVCHQDFEANYEGRSREVQDTFTDLPVTVVRGDSSGVPSTITLDTDVCINVPIRDEIKFGRDSTTIEINNVSVNFVVTPESRSCTYLFCESEIRFVNVGATNVTFNALDVSVAIEQLEDFYVDFSLKSNGTEVMCGTDDCLANSTNAVVLTSAFTTTENVTILLVPNSSQSFRIRAVMDHASDQFKYNVSLFYADQTWLVDPFFNSNSSDFVNGTFQKTFLNASGFVQLNISAFTEGSFRSQVFDSGSFASWNNFSWEVNTGDIATSGNQDGIILLYHMDTDSDFGENVSHMFDFTGNGHNASCDVIDCPDFTTNGIFGNALDFEVADHSQVNVQSSLLNFTAQDFSTGAWINTVSSSTANVMGRFSSQGWELQTSPTNAVWFLRDASDNFITGSTSIDDGNYHFLVGTYNASSNEAILYVDGVQDASAVLISGGNDFSDEDAMFSVGARFGGGNPFDGLIDEVSVWNKTLTQEEINDLFGSAFTRLNMSFRSCNDAVCSGELFSGNFSEDQDNLTIPNNRYFQYEAYFNSSINSETPRLFNTSIGFEILFAPNITDVMAVPDPVNLGSFINISANVTDDIGVDTVFVQIDGQNFTMINVGGDIFLNITNTTAFGIGLVNFTVFANDTDGFLVAEFGSFVVKAPEALEIGVCPSTTGSVLILILLVLISLAFILMGFATGVGFIGFFGAVMLMVTSWFLAGCVGFFAFIIALLSFVLMIYFVVTGIGFKNQVFE